MKRLTVPAIFRPGRAVCSIVSSIALLGVILSAPLNSFRAIGENRTANTNQLSSIFESLQRSTSQLRELTPRMGFESFEADNIKGWLNSLDSNIKYLAEIADSQTPTKIPPQYDASLRSNARLLETLTRYKSPSATDREKLFKGLGDVALDLQIKVTYSRSALGSAFRLVQIVIHTKKQDKEIGGYQVWYVPKGWAAVKDEAKPFDRLSSPTYMELSPGNYVMWTHKDGANSKSQPVSLGEDGRSKKEIDLLIE